MNRSPAGRLRLDVPLPVATFKARVEERVWLLPFEEQLHKEFELTILQRQSWDWYSRCCGLSLGAVLDGLEARLRRRAARKLREQVERELALVEAAATGPRGKK